MREISKGHECQGTAAPAALGEKVFVECEARHQIGEGAHTAVDPRLDGLIGRHFASVPDYPSSEAMNGSAIFYDATFRDDIEDPKAKIPGTEMNFAGMS